MSWIDKVNTNFTIITAEGKSFTVDWMNAVREKEYFIAEFNFPNLAGSKVDRGQPKGRRYSLELFFQGENNIENAIALEDSTDANTGPWTIRHPIYGQIIVQPIGLKLDNTAMNVTKVLTQAIETITQDNPVTVVDPVDNILLDKEILDANFANSLDKTPVSSDVNNMTSSNNSLYNKSVPIIKIPEDLTNYFNLFQVAKSAINNAIQSPIIAMRTTQAVISAPALFQTDVQSRLGVLNSQYSSLKNQIVPKNSYQVIPVSTKQIFQIQAGTLIASQLVAASTPQPNNYTNANTVINVIETLLNNYNSYLSDLDSIQTSTAGTPTSFIPDAASLIGLNQLMSSVISNLFKIALIGKQERTLILEKDTNIIILTYRLYGLDEFDNNISELIANNNWGLNQILQIRKNTPVKYYI
jgi:hypothetical protein